MPLYLAVEPAVFDNDESLGHEPVFSERSCCQKNVTEDTTVNTIEIKTYPEVSAAA
jgi:hypothetical protein